MNCAPPTTLAKPPAFPPLAELARALRAGELTSVALTHDCLKRIADHDGTFRSFIAVYADEARAAAELADRELRDGRARSPLHGIPVALKDLVDLRGKPTTAGSPLLAHNVAAQDAELVDRIRDAGGIVIGKTHLVQFALGAWGTNAHMHTPRNPAGRQGEDLAPGGSSSGSAVAVAAHLVPWAVGSDTGGSVRVPAAFCGIVGFKPTIHALPREGVYPLSDTLDSIGILANSVEDATLVFRTLSDGGPPQPPAQHRIGYLEADELDILQPDVARNVAASLELLRQGGFELVPFRFPAALAAFKDPTGAIMISEGAVVNDRFLDDPALPIDPAVGPRMVAARKTTAVEYLRARAQAVAWQKQFADDMARAGIAAIAMPVTAGTAPRIEEIDHGIAPVHFTRPANLLALCAISIPAGADRRGRPIGFQLVGGAGQDAHLLDVAAAAARLLPQQPS